MINAAKALQAIGAKARFVPPLVVSPAQIDQALAILDRSL